MKAIQSSCNFLGSPQGVIVSSPCYPTIYFLHGIPHRPQEASQDGILFIHSNNKKFMLNWPQMPRQKWSRSTVILCAGGDYSHVSHGHKRDLSRFLPIDMSYFHFCLTGKVNVHQWTKWSSWVPGCTEVTRHVQEILFQQRPCVLRGQDSWDSLTDSDNFLSSVMHLITLQLLFRHIFGHNAAAIILLKSQNQNSREPRIGNFL